MSSSLRDKEDDGIYGDAYIELMDADEESRRIRQGFQEAVGAIAPPGCEIFDFGAGPGVDAKHYASCGHRVIAYDNDPRMCQSFKRHCASELATGQVQLFEGTYDDFLLRHAKAIRAQHSTEVITANFAPLTLITDLPPLFNTFSSLTSTRGMLLASVLNPSFVGDMHYRWWWQKRIDYWRNGEFSVAGALGPIWRRSCSRISGAAAPHFRLTKVWCDRPMANTARARSSGMTARLTSRYLFLLFQKTVSR